jgi:hypothetical protein
VTVVKARKITFYNYVDGVPQHLAGFYGPNSTGALTGADNYVADRIDVVC